MAIGILGLACVIGMVASLGVGLASGSWLLALLAYSGTGVLMGVTALAAAALGEVLPARTTVAASTRRRTAAG